MNEEKKITLGSGADCLREFDNLIDCFRNVNTRNELMIAILRVNGSMGLSMQKRRDFLEGLFYSIIVSFLKALHDQNIDAEIIGARIADEYDNGARKILVEFAEAEARFAGNDDNLKA